MNTSKYQPGALLYHNSLKIDTQLLVYLYNSSFIAKFIMMIVNIGIDKFIVHLSANYMAYEFKLFYFHIFNRIVQFLPLILNMYSIVIIHAYQKCVSNTAFQATFEMDEAHGRFHPVAAPRGHGGICPLPSPKELCPQNFPCHFKIIIIILVLPLELWLIHHSYTE